MSVWKWIVFCLNLVLRYGPKLVKLGRRIWQSVEDAKDDQGVPLKSAEKAVEFDRLATRAWIMEQEAAPTRFDLVSYRERICQRQEGRNWKSPYAAESGLDQWYT